MTPLIASLSNEHHVFKCILDERFCVGLRHMTCGAEIATRGDVREYLAVAIHEVSDADHRRARAFGVLPTVTVEATVRFQRKLIAVDRMGNDRRLLRVISHHALVVGDRTRKRRRGNFLHRLRATGHSRHDLRSILCRKRSATTTSARPAGAGNRPRNNAQTETILTAHFLKSVCFDIGSVASSVALLMSWLASNQARIQRPAASGFARACRCGSASRPVGKRSRLPRPG